MDRLRHNDVKTKQVEELTDLMEICIKGKVDIIDIYIKAAKLDERYKTYKENLQLIRLVMQQKIGF